MATVATPQSEPKAPTRTFPLEVILSLYDGRSFDGAPAFTQRIVDLASWMVGERIGYMHLAFCIQACAASLEAQFPFIRHVAIPDLREEERVKAWLKRVRRRWGDTRDVKPIGMRPHLVMAFDAGARAVRPRRSRR